MNLLGEKIPRRMQRRRREDREKRLVEELMEWRTGKGQRSETADHGLA